MTGRDDDEAAKPLEGGAHIRLIEPQPPRVMAFDDKAVKDFLEAFTDEHR